MTSQSAIERAAEYQAAQHRAGKPLDLMLQPFAPTTMADAYAVQDALVRRLSDARGAAAGYKVAYTNAVMRERSGVREACYGRIPSGMVHRSPARIDSSLYGGVGIECEVGVMLGADLPAAGAPYTRDSIAYAIDWLAAAFEVVDRRDAPYLDGQMPEIRTIVTNISNGGAVLGAPVEDWRGIDLAASRGVMSVNGVVAGEGVGADVLGHPIAPLVWLANTLAAQGKPLAKGDLILTGSFAAPATLQPGDSAVSAIDGLGEARLTVE